MNYWLVFLIRFLWLIMIMYMVWLVHWVINHQYCSFFQWPLYYTFTSYRAYYNFFLIQSFTFCPSSLVFLLFIWVVVYSHSFNLYHILVGLWFSYLISPLLSFSHFLSFIQMYYSVYIYFTLLLHLLYVKVSMWSTTVEFSYLLHWVYHGHKDYHRGY